MPSPPNPRLRKALLEVVHNQLRDNDPPETAQTLTRLMREGHSRKQALEFIACVVATEIFEVLKQGRLYDHARYVAGLQALPRLPWEEEQR